MAPRQVVVKVMTVNKPADMVFDFFSGKGKMKFKRVYEYGILDHKFVGAGLKWKVYVGVVPNEEGSTTTWTFMRPDGLTDDQFQEQLKGFEVEVNNWKRYLEEN